jgi:DNA adenine methylase
MAPRIAALLPPHDVYVEPFGGAASVLLVKAPAPVEVYNDLDGEVVAFFRVLRERPEALLQSLRLTPYSRQELSLAVPDPAAKELERARRLYVRCWQSFGEGQVGSTGWRFQRRTHRYSVTDGWVSEADLLLAAARLAHVQIECDDAPAVIDRYDGEGALFLVDPPYPRAVRTRPDHGYYAELTDDGHRALAKRLGRIRGRAIVCGYDGDLYRELYAGWRRVSLLGSDRTGAPRKESVWLSPACAGRQPTLWEGHDA